MPNQRNPQFVIREAMPPRQRWLLAGLAAAILLGAWGTFEYGRSRAGFDFFHAATDRRELTKKLNELAEENSALKAKLAAGETERLSLTRERAEVAKTIGELQAEVSRQTQELAFYKGIVAQGGSTEDVQVQRIRVEKGDAVGRFRLKISLVRRVQSETLVSGVVGIQVAGQQKGQALSLDLRQLTQGRKQDLPYSFRYVENLDTDLVVPVDFQPERVTVEVRSARKGINPLVQTAVWDTEAT